MDRRKFIGSSALAIGAAAILPFSKVKAAKPVNGTWEDFRALFKLDPAYHHMTQMLLASHPKPVRDAIDAHRKHLDENPTEYWEKNFVAFDKRVTESAAKYLACDPEEIMLTDSTTMGLGLLYTGLKLNSSDEVLTSTHDHYSTEKSLEYAAMKTGMKIKRVPFYSTPSKANAEEIVATITKNVGASTRIVAITWVHSVSGVKLPVSLISEAIRKLNESRSPSKRIYLCVDGVHGFGVDDITMKQMGCDFFVAGTHKWIFGPRGTGILYAKKDAWDMINPTIPAFTELSYGMWMGAIPQGKIHFSDLQSPGGFHSFEHRWALNVAFDMLMGLGKDNVMRRTQDLNDQLKNGLKEIRHIKLHTPLDKNLSAGITCFEVDGMNPDTVLEKLYQKKIISSITPYKVKLNRLTPCALNMESEVTACIKALESIKSS